MATSEVEVKPADPIKNNSKEHEDGARRVLVLLHGEKSNDARVRDAISRLRKEGHKVMVRMTYEAGDVDRLVKEALALDSSDTLVAAGGDGTVNEVVSALLKHTGGLKDTRALPAGTDNGGGGRPAAAEAQGAPPSLKRPSVAVLPLGTSNDFAATTGIPADPYQALKLATKSSRLRPLDVGLLNGQVFMNTATIGASAELGVKTSSKIKKILGPAAFLFTGAESMASWAPAVSDLTFPESAEDKANALARKLSQDSFSRGSAELSPGNNSTQSRAATTAEEPAGSITEDNKQEQEQQGQQEEGEDGQINPADNKAAANETGSTVGVIKGIPLLHVTLANNRQVASTVSVSPDALLDDGMLDILYVTGNAGEHVKRLVKDVLTKGLDKTKVGQNLLRVPWLEISSEQPLEWSTDGEHQDPAATNFRATLLHRAVHFHLPDGPVVANRADDHKEKKHRNAIRIPRGRIRAPSLGEMLRSVVRFRKQQDWNQIIRDGVMGTVKILMVFGAGAATMHFWYRRRRSEIEGEL